MIRVDVTVIVCVERELACNWGPEQSFRLTGVHQVKSTTGDIVTGHVTVGTHVTDCLKGVCHEAGTCYIVKARIR